MNVKEEEVNDRFCKKGVSYNNEESPSFYDHVFSTSEEYKRNFKNSSYYNIYASTLEILIANQAKAVLEAGCGCGIFSSMLKASNVNISYCGFDFSQVGIDKARARCPNYTYHYDNIYTTNLFESYPYDTVVSHEVLEHISDDIGVIRRIREGSLFIGSVPNFDCASHVRYFTSEKQVFYRYSRCLKIEKIIFLDGMYLFYGKVI